MPRPTRGQTSRSFSPRRGFTLVEVLIAMGLLAALMAALGAGLHVSVQSYQENALLADVTQTARTVLGRITRDIRTASAVDANAAVLTIIPSDTSGPDQVVYYYDSDTHTLYYRTVKDAAQQDYPLIGGGDGASVTAFHASGIIGEDWQGLQCTRSVTVHLNYSVGGRSHALTASADPRRNQSY